jgi:hypothetical protein
MWRDGEHGPDVEPAMPRLSERELQRRREDALRMMIQPAREVPAALNRAREAKSRAGLLTISASILLGGLIAGGGALAIVHFNDQPSPTANPVEDGRGKTAFGNSAGGRQAAKEEPHLQLSALNGAANRPIALGVDVSSPTPGSFVVIRGVPAGGRVTAGIQIRDGEWRVALRDLLSAQVMPPQDYLGTLDLPIDLRGSDDRVIESKTQRLTWQSTSGAASGGIWGATSGANWGPPPAAADPAPTTLAGSEPRPSTPAAPPPRSAPERLASAGPAQSLIGERPAPPARAAAIDASRQIDAGELKNLLQRALLALQNRDVAAARLLLQRAADGGNAQAAAALAATYDPDVLKQLGALGAQANIERAREWYQKAAQWGSPEAGSRLSELQQTAQ